MNPGDFEREPRSGNTRLHKLNPHLSQKKKTPNSLSLFVPSQLFVPFHGAQNHSHKTETPNSQYFRSLSQCHSKTLHQLHFITLNFINEKTQKKKKKKIP